MSLEKSDVDIQKNQETFFGNLIF